MSVTVHPPGKAEADTAAAPAPAETPSQRVIRAANEVQYVTDDNGRKIGWRPLDALEDFDLSGLAGPQNCNNQQWMMRAAWAMSIRSINGEKCDRITSMRELRAMIARLGREGMAAMWLTVPQQPEPAEGEEGDEPESSLPAAEDRAKN